MKEVTYSKLIRHYFNANTMAWFSSEAFRLLRITPTLSFPDDSACYITMYGSARTYISLGRKFYNEAVAKKDSKEKIDPKLLKKTYKDISAIYKAALYHEVSHKLFTDMPTFADYISTLSDRGYTDLANLFKIISNIVEDVVIEDEFEFYYPSIGKFLQYLRLRIFSKEIIDSFQKDMDVESANDLITFILYRYRNPANVTFEHPLYTANKKALHSSMYVCLNTVNPTKRLQRALAFAYEFLMLFVDSSAKPIDIDEVLKGKDLAWIKSLPVQSPPSVPTISGKGGSPTDMTGKEKSESPTMQPSSKEKGAEGEEDQELKDKLQDSDGGTAQRDTLGSSPLPDKPSTAPDPDSDKISDAITRQAANDEPVVNYMHTCFNIHDYIDFKPYSVHYKGVVAEHSDKINKLVNIIKKMKAVNNNRYERHQKKGKLDKRKMVKEVDTLKVFKKRLAPRKEADLAFSLLVDNSGSMMGRKSIVVGNALIILQETLYRLRIPFEVNAFTEHSHGGAITLEMHRFNDSFNKTKNSACLFTRQVEFGYPLYTFHGNVDESNLEFVGNRFINSRKEKDKILIVLSDGATCGSERVLSRVSKNFESKGITMLGVGIIDDNVEDIYKDHYTFSSVEDLQNLAGVIQRYILNKVFK